jgi:hypothetical protein
MSSRAAKIEALGEYMSQLESNMHALSIQRADYEHEASLDPATPMEQWYLESKTRLKEGRRLHCRVRNLGFRLEMGKRTEPVGVWMLSNGGFFIEVGGRKPITFIVPGPVQGRRTPVGDAV